MKFLSSILAFIGALFTHKAAVDVAEPVQTDNGTSQTTTVTTSQADIIEADVEKAITIVNNIKNALASPVAVLITDLIPGTLDDAIREKLVSDLPVLVSGLTFANSFLKGSDKSTQINALLANIKFSDDADLNALWHTLAARILMIISGNVSWTNAVMAVEYYFTHIFLQTESAPAGSAVALPAAKSTN